MSEEDKAFLYMVLAGAAAGGMLLRRPPRMVLAIAGTAALIKAIASEYRAECARG